MALRGLDEDEQIDKLISKMKKDARWRTLSDDEIMDLGPLLDANNQAMNPYRSSQPPSLQLEILSIQAAMLDRMLGEFNRIAAGAMLLTMGIVLASGLSFAVALAVGLGLAMVGKGLANQALTPEIMKNKIAMARAKDSGL